MTWHEFANLTWRIHIQTSVPVSVSCRPNPRLILSAEGVVKRLPEKKNSQVNGPKIYCYLIDGRAVAGHDMKIPRVRNPEPATRQFKIRVPNITSFPLDFKVWNVLPIKGPNKTEIL